MFRRNLKTGSKVEMRNGDTHSIVISYVYLILFLRKKVSKKELVN
jgi:hypothetical protein